MGGSLGEYSWLDPQLALSALKLLFDVYVFRRKSDDQRAPDPEKIREVIDEVRSKPAQNAHEIAAAIERRMGPDSAAEVTRDLSFLAALAQPPRFSSFDYWSFLAEYSRCIQHIARQLDLFRIFGGTIGSSRFLLLPSLGPVILDKELAPDYVHRFGSFYQASVDRITAVLTDESVDFPVRVEIHAVFESCSSFGTQSSEDRYGRYKVERGQEGNWLAFHLVQSSPGFLDGEWHLRAAEASAILNAMQGDLLHYSRELGKDLEISRDIERALNDLRAVSGQS